MPEKTLYAGIDESGLLRDGGPFVLACALSYNKGETLPYEGKSPGKQKHIKTPHNFGDFRFLTMYPQMLEEAKKIYNGNHGAPEYKLRTFACAYLLNSVDNTNVSVVVDSFADPEKLERGIEFYWNKLSQKKQGLALKCMTSADTTIPIVNRADAIARFTFRHLKKGKEMQELGKEFEEKYVDVNSGKFLESFASAL